MPSVAGDVAGAARPVVDDHRLAEALRELVAIERTIVSMPVPAAQLHDDGDRAARIAVGEGRRIASSAMSASARPAQL